MENNREITGISWHSGFYGAMELELIAEKGLLEFLREYPLSKEPLRMDMLIIRKQSGQPVVNEIGHMFRTYNILEYKSPDSPLSIDDYYKTMGYACLYKGLGERLNQIPAEELTVSIIRERYPGRLFEDLKKEGKKIGESFPGIYKISGSVPFETQVIVSSRLSREKHRSLRLLSSKVQKEDARAFLREAQRLKEPGDRNNAEAVLEVSIAANKELYEEIRRKSGMGSVLRDLMKEEIAEEKRKARQEGLQEGRQEGRREGRREGRKEGRREGRQEGWQEGQQQALTKTIQSLMINMKLSADQAMAVMGIPAEERGFYRARL